MAIKLYHWEPNEIINQPRKKKNFVSDSDELQGIIDEITWNLPDILSSDKKKVISSKLQKL